MINSTEIRFFALNFKISPNRRTKCRRKLNYGLKQRMDFTAFNFQQINTLRTGDADLRFYITTVQDG